MNENSFIRKSNVTHIEYDYFQCIKILNFAQAEFYINNNVELKDIIFSNDKKTGKRIVVFYFYKEDTKDAYNKWCELSKKDD